MLQDASPAVLLLQRRLADRLPEHSAQVLFLEDGWGADAAEVDAPADVGLRREHLAYVIFTSGSTGRPKGVMNTHDGICNRLLWMQQTYGLGSSDVVLQKTPFSFDVSVWEFFWPLLSGARLTLARPGGHKDPAYLSQLIHDEAVTVCHFVPSMLQAFLQEPDLEQKCVSLRDVMCSGEALPYELQERFFARLPPRLHNLYGPTEAAVDVTFWPCRRGDGRQAGAHRQAGGQHADARPGRQASACAGGRAWRSPHRRRAGGSRLPQPPGTHGGTIHRGTGGAWPAVQNGRRGPLAVRRRDRLPGPAGPSGEAARLPHRTGRDRIRADGTLCRARGGGDGPRGQSRRQTPCRLCRARGGRGCLSGRAAFPGEGEASGVHDAIGVRGHGIAAAEPQRQGRSQGPVRA